MNSENETKPSKEESIHEPAPVMGASKNEFFALERSILKQIRSLLFNLYQKKNWGLVPPPIKRADIILSKRITKINRILKKSEPPTC